MCSVSISCLYVSPILLFLVSLRYYQSPIHFHSTTNLRKRKKKPVQKMCAASPYIMVRRIELFSHNEQSNSRPWWSIMNRKKEYIRSLLIRWFKNSLSKYSRIQSNILFAIINATSTVFSYLLEMVFGSTVLFLPCHFLLFLPYKNPLIITFPCAISQGKDVCFMNVQKRSHFVFLS